MPTTLRHLLVTALTVPLVACGAPSVDSEEVAELRLLLEEQALEQQAFEERLGEFEQALAELAEDRSADRRLEGLEDELARLDETLDGLGAELAAEADAREEVAAAADRAAGDLRDTLAEVRSSVDRARGEIEMLRTELEALRERLDRIPGS